jgi:hypothetical protein
MILGLSLRAVIAETSQQSPRAPCCSATLVGGRLPNSLLNLYPISPLDAGFAEEIKCAALREDVTIPSLSAVPAPMSPIRDEG